MNIVFLDAGTFYGYPNLNLMLEKYGNVSLYDSTEPDEIVERIQGAEIVLTNKVVLGRSIFEQCAGLKLVCVTATGTNNIDHGAAKDFGVTIKNAAGYSTNSVAQATFAMALHLLMRLERQHAFVTTNYHSHPFFTHLSPGFSEIGGKNWGIIGLGAIGKQVAQIATAMGAHVSYFSPSGQNNTGEYTQVSLAGLLASSDIISIHTPLNEHSKGLIGAKELQACKKNAILINVARGGIVDELALAMALESGTIAGAGIDVFQTEPIPSDNPLLSLSARCNLVLTPHIAWGSYEARKKLMDITCQNIEDYLGTK